MPLVQPMPMLEPLLSGLLLLAILGTGAALGWLARGHWQAVVTRATTTTEDAAVVHPTGPRLVDPHVAADRLAQQNAAFADLPPLARDQVMTRLRAEAEAMGLGR